MPGDEQQMPNQPPHQHTLPDGRTVALGRPRVKRDARTLQFAKYLVLPSLPQPPATLNLSHALGATPWGMYNNDRWGDCTAASVAHQIMLDAAMLGQSNVPALVDVLNLYAGVTASEGAQFDPATGANDNGALELDVLNYWRHNAVSGNTLNAFAAVKQNDLTAVRTAMMLMGGLYIGVALPKSAKDQVGKVWDVVDGPDGEPNSWGGHAGIVTDYDWNASTHMLTMATWDGLQLMTEAFWLKHVDEAYATLTDAWKVRAPMDLFNFDLLLTDLSQFGQVNPTFASR